MDLLAVMINANESSSAARGNSTDPVYEAGENTTVGQMTHSDLGSQVNLEHVNHSVSTTIGAPVEFDSGQTAWILSCVAITWLMLPGVGLFYNGMAPRKSSLVLLISCLWSCAVVSLQWYLIGYTLCLSDTGGPFMGNLDHLLLRNIDDSPANGNDKIPALLQGVWYCLFAAITPTIILGGIVERARFLPSIVFILLWSTFVFDVITYWCWNSNGWILRMGVLDFGGGTPVHISTGTAALAYAIILGKRRDPRDKPPHNMSHIILGTSFVWLGWLVANAGSGLRPNLRATLVIVTTNLSASVGGIVWALMDYRREQKFSAFGFCCGVVAGLVTITPASGYVNASSSIIFGVAGAVVCNLSLGIKKYMKVDDAFDVFAIHGLGGILGNLLTGLMAESSIAAVDGTLINGGWVNGNWAQVPYQIIDTLAGGTWSFAITIVIVWVLDQIPALRLRVDPEVEESGIDDAELGEEMYGFVKEIESSQNKLAAGVLRTSGPDLPQDEIFQNPSDHVELGTIPRPNVPE